MRTAGDGSPAWRRQLARMVTQRIAAQMAQPRIEDGAVVIKPAKFVIFGTMFTASDVLSQVRFPGTRYPLPALPARLAYTGIRVVRGGLLVTVSGTNVILTKGMFGSG